MRYMILVRATAYSEAGNLAPASSFDAMTDYHEELARAGVLVDCDGLQPSAKGWRIAWRGDERHRVDAPFAEPKELIAGFTIIRVASREEAEAWAARYPRPVPGDCEIEVRRMYDPEDLREEVPTRRFRAGGVASGET